MEKVKPIYGELIGYLSAAPDNTTFIRNEDANRKLKQFNEVVDELSKITGDDYSRFKLELHYDADEPYIYTNDYRTQINGLIMRLHHTYFNDQIAPFSGSPTTQVNQTQVQSQSQFQIVMLLEISNLISQRLSDTNLEEKEKNFLQKLKEQLPNITTSVELISTILTIAKTLGLDPSQLSKTLGL